MSRKRFVRGSEPDEKTDAALRRFADVASMLAIELLMSIWASRKHRALDCRVKYTDASSAPRLSSSPKGWLRLPLEVLNSPMRPIAVHSSARTCKVISASTAIAATMILLATFPRTDYQIDHSGSVL